MAQLKKILPKTLLEALQARVEQTPGKMAFRFLQTGDADGAYMEVTYSELDQKARSIAVDLQSRGFRDGTALLLYPSCLDFIFAYFGCLYAGLTPVPSVLPEQARMERMLPRLQALIDDSTAKVALTLQHVVDFTAPLIAKLPNLQGLHLIGTDSIKDDNSIKLIENKPSPEDICFLQYTSGSTSLPKGVMVSHKNILSNLQDFDMAWHHDDATVGVSWLPIFHDLGFIYGILNPIYKGFPCYFMTPESFLARPARWLEAISRFKGTHSCAPNFAYELCIKRITPEQRLGLDLSSWVVALNAAEPVRLDTLKNFYETFKNYGLRWETLSPGYGLAEATLKVTTMNRGEAPRFLALDPAQLEKHNVKIITNTTETSNLRNIRWIAACGRTCGDTEVVIVDPETLEVCPTNKIGEIWISGSSVAKGYWQRDDETIKTFHAHINSNKKDFKRDYLRTGDLGFLNDGLLYITARIKDLIIIRGRNIYPSDIEQMVEHTSAVVRQGCVAAFSIEQDTTEALVVVAEVDVTKLTQDGSLESLALKIRKEIWEQYEVRANAVCLIEPKSIFKTSSGKIQRAACKKAFLNQSLKVLYVLSEHFALVSNTELNVANNKQQDIINNLVNIKEQQKKHTIQKLIADIIIELLGPINNLSFEAGFMDLGMDSVTMVEFGDRVSSLFNPLAKGHILLNSSVSFDYPTVNALVEHLLTDILQLQDKEITATGNTSGYSGPIAIIGMGCKLPGGVNTPSEFWQNLVNEVDAITDIPKERFNVADYYDNDPHATMKMYVKGAGIVDQIDKFDANFFGVHASEAIALDPQQRLLLETSWEAFENANIIPFEQDQLRTGVFVGIVSGEYENLIPNSKQLEQLEAYMITGNTASAAAGRLSYFYGLQGPSIAVDTACSSSLVAVHLACESLRNYGCDQALAAGVNALITPENFMLLSNMQALSPSNHCKTFDADADGYVRGEGCGVIILKRLDDAIAAKDNILAIIKGSAVAQDGKSSTMTAPNGASQQRLILDTLNLAKVSSSEIGYVETHGTGTRLGDPIEFNSLARVYGLNRSKDQPLILGAVKTNIGHLEAAAGIAGIIKVILAMQHNQIPGNINFNKLNPAIDLNLMPTIIPTRLQEWPAYKDKRLAAVSSFGITGTIAHIILEQWQNSELKNTSSERSSLNPSHKILCLSGKNTAAVKDLVISYQKQVLTADNVELEDVCFTANTGRAHFEQRLAVVAKSPAEMSARLNTWLESGESIGVTAGRIEDKEQKIAFVFTGQGSQYIGMGKELYETSPTFKNCLDICADILTKNNYLDKPLLSVLWGEDSKLIDETKYTQPALFALEYALSTLWLSWGITPSAVIGHSVGEYVAACVAGVFSLEDGLKLISKRAALMQALAQNGAMAAIAVGEQVILEAIKPFTSQVTIAAVNGPESVVISGNTDAVKKLTAEFVAKGIKTKELQVSHAFHSHLLEPMLSDFEAVLRDIKLSKPTISLISNLTGSEVLSEDIITPEYWVKHTRNAVRFSDGINALINLGITSFIEIGPQPVLLGMAQESIQELTNKLFLPSLRKDKDNWSQLLESLAALYVTGVAINWKDFDKDYNCQRVQLPTYPFQRQRYWIDNVHKPGTAINAIGQPLLGTMLQSAFDDTDVTIFNSKINLNIYPYLQEHQVYGNIVIPGAAYVSMALAAAPQLLGASVVENMVIEQPLVLDNNAEYNTELQLIITKNKGNYQFRIISRSEGQGWIQHATGIIKAQDSIIHAAVDLNKIRNQCTESIPKLVLYKYFETIGLEYSGAFQGITELYKNNREAFGIINLPETAVNQGYIIHPALLDAAFQVMAALGYSNDTTEAYLPFEIAHVAINGPISRKVLVHVVARESNDAKVKISDLYLYDESGALLLEITGFSAVRANKVELLTIINSQNKARVEDLLYTLKWREQILQNTSSETIPKSWCIISENKNITNKLIASIKESGDNVTTELPTVAAQLDRVVYICGDEKLTNIDKPNCIYEQALELTQHLVKNKILTDTGKLIFVTQNAQQVNDLQDEYSLTQAPLIGLARVIALEHPELHSRIIDLDAADLNIELLLTELNAVDAEGQVAFRQGTRFVPRLVKYTKALNPYIDTTYLGFDSKGSIDNLEFKPLVKKALKPDEIEIEVVAAGLNFRDVLNVMGLYPGDPGPLGIEASGIITAVGANVTGFKVGEEVLAEASGAFGKYVTTPYHLATHKPKNISFADAAAIPVVFLTVHYAFNILAKLKAGEKVLIHAAAGGIGMAAIQIAKNLGAEIFVTVGNAAKRKLMQDMGISDDHIMNSRNTDYASQIMQVTNNKGVDVVLNSLTGGDFIPKSLSALASNGRFLEIGKRDIWTEEQVKELRPDVQYSIIAIDALSQQQPELIGKLLTELMQEFATGKLEPISVTQYPVIEAKKAFRFMAQGKHTGKIVLTMQDKQTQKEIKPIIIKADANYLITGGLGGLGLEVAKWLAAQGAKNLILVSRSLPSVHAKEVISNLEQAGVTVKVIQADIAKSSDVANIFKQFKMTGVIHAAGVLDDAELTQQNFDKYLKVSNPKVLGAINLQDAIVNSKQQLDLFVSFSSVAAILGNMGQSNYAAANAFLDTFASYQRQQNVNAISINWGAWSKVGLAANMDNASIEQMALYGIKAINPDTGIMALEQILFRSALVTEPIVLDINWQRYFSQVDVSTQPVLGDMAVGFKSIKPIQYDRNNELVQKLLKANTTNRYEILSQYMAVEVKKIMSLDASATIDMTAGLSAMGMDSLMAVEFRNRITKSLGSSFSKALPATLMFNYPNINALTKYLLEDVLLLEEKQAANISGFNNTITAEPIAIIGASCRFPGGANSLDQYWGLLINGIDAISEVPKDRWSLDEYYDPDPDIPGKMYCKWGGFLTNIPVQDFDAQFFDIVPSEAKMMDPQQRIALEVTWEALENADIIVDDLKNTITGVFFGASTYDYAQIVEYSNDITAYTNSGVAHSVLAGRISYELGLQGSSLVLDTACSSSLVAIHQACTSLKTGESNLAIAGGVNMMLTPNPTIGFCKGSFLAVDGRCKTFDESANGYVRGEGCGVIILKRLSDAIRDGDNILAVIKGSAVNQDGASGGLTVPNGPAQETVISQALLNANIKPNEISYVEAHGTGTSLGDPIEVNALENVLKEGRSKDQSLIISSVKTNIGHLEAAAGMASIIKVILALQHEEIPRHLHFNKMNPNINIDDDINIVIPVKNTKWQHGERKRIAGISSFAFQGTNAHIIIEEAPLINAVISVSQQKDRPLHLLAISAKTVDALQELAISYINLLNKNSNKLNYLANLCFSSNCFRTQFAQKLSIVGYDASDAKSKLQAWIEKGDNNEIPQNIPKVALLFTGQGSQYPGMGKELYDTSPTFKKHLDQCADILLKNSYLDKPLLSILWGADSKFIDETKYTQPALFAFEYALSQLWISWGIIPTALIGHSVGEYVAACVAKVFSLEDGLKLISKRAALMQELSKNGSMAAIAVNENTIINAIKPYEGQVNIAAINGPESIVISGDADAVKKITLQFKEKNTKTKALQVSHAFHSYLLEPMLNDFESVLREIKFATPNFSLISNLTGAEVKNEEIVTVDYWIHHTRQAVRFNDGIKSLINLGVSSFIEIGPNPVLLGMAQESVPDIDDDKYSFLPSMRQDIESWAEILTSLSRLYVSGVAINWKNFDKDYSRIRVSLPTYPFQRQRYWVDIKDKYKNVTSNLDHPILVNRIDSARDGSTVFTTELSPKYTVMLEEHKVYDVPVLPAVTYLELVMASVARLIDNATILEIEDIGFEKALALSYDDSAEMQVNMISNDQGYDFSIYSRILSASNTNEWNLNVSGIIKVVESSYRVPQFDLEAIQQRAHNNYTGTEFLTRAHEAGMTFGPRFSSLQQVWIGDGEALGEIILAPEYKTEINDYEVYPAIFDTGLQLLIANLPFVNNKEVVHLPIAISKLIRYGKPTAKSWVYVSWQPLDEHVPEMQKSLHGDIKLLDEYGNVVVEVIGLTAVEAPRDTVLQDLQHSNSAPCYEIVWQKQQQEHLQLDIPKQLWIVFSGANGLAQSLYMKSSDNSNIKFIEIGAQSEYQIDITNKEDYRQILAKILCSNEIPKQIRVVNLLPLDSKEVIASEHDVIQNQKLCYESTLYISQTLIELSKTLSSNNTFELLVVTSGVYDSKTLWQSQVWGLGKVLALEVPQLSYKLIDIDSIDNGDALFKELLLPQNLEMQVALQQDERLVARLKTSEINLKQSENIVFKNSANYWITGGLGGIGFVIAKWMLDRGARNIVLIARSTPTAEVQKIMADLNTQYSANIQYLQLDVADFTAIEKVFQNNKPTGIIHAAGVLDDNLLPQQTWQSFEHVMRPKILGAWNLHKLTVDIELDFLVLFSSQAAVLGNIGQANYAAANAFLDALANYRNSKGLNALSIDWGPWLETGMMTRSGYQQELNAQGMSGIKIAQGLLYLEALMLDKQYHQVGVFNIDWPVYLDNLYIKEVPALFNNIEEQKNKKIRKTQKHAAKSQILEQLQKVTTDQQRKLIQTFLIDELIKLLGPRLKGTLSINTGFMDLGVDSLLAVEFRKILKANFEGYVKIAPTAAFDYPNIEAMGDYILSQLAFDENTPQELSIFKTNIKARITNNLNDPIAIIGMSCRMPGGANSLDEYWRLLENGIDAISEVPSDRWNLDDYYDPDPDAPGKMYSKWGGFLNNVDVAAFDAPFFNITPAEARDMDPQQRMLLEVVWEALEIGGINPRSLNKSATAMFVAQGTNDYSYMLYGDLNNISPYSNSGLAGSVTAGRVSYILGLQGPCMMIDTACSASLIAIHEACNSLRYGESDLAIAGGVNLDLSPELTIGFCKARMLSEDGRCKTFDASANGYARGEGCGVVILKRLSDAKRDGDRVLAIVRGSAINQDGSSGGLTVPNGPAQQAVIQTALQQAGIKPHDVSYVETHGTGTSLGDPIEVQALGNVYGEGRDSSNPITIGSVKTNFGHLETAAGMASIIKVVLAMQHKKIPKHLNFKTINPMISLEDIPATIPTETRDWVVNSGPRIAGMSGFAFQGSNAHVIVEEAPLLTKPISTINRSQFILCLSGKNIVAVKDLVISYQKQVLNADNVDLEDVCFTANTGRAHFEQRLAVVAKSPAEMSARLNSWLESGEAVGAIAGRIADKEQKLAFVFTGQGSQYIGMGRELYETSPTFKNYLDISADILIKNNYLDKPLLSVLWGENSKLIDETKYTQPALFALEYALCRLWLSWGITPSAVIGHSVGEYVAACVTGVFSLDDGLRLICKRAALMQALAQNGAMAAIAVSEQVINEAIEPYKNEVTIAAVNGPESVVISGNTDAIKKLTAEFATKGIKTKELQVSHAFHSHLLEPMLADFEIVLRDIKLSKPTISLISNLTGYEVSSDEIIAPEYWVKHTRNAVRFSDGINTLVNLGITSFIEIGPQPVLLGMAQESIQELTNKLFLPSLRKDKDNWAQLLESLAELYVTGVAINWKDFDKDYSRQRVQLPTYPFQRQRYWIDNVHKPGTAANNIGTPLLGTMLQSAFDGTEVTIFNSDINLNIYPYLTEHQVYGHIVVPGAAYVSMALAAARQLFGVFVIENMVIEQPLVLDNNTEYNTGLQLIITKNKDSYQFRIISRSEGQSWIQHASGIINVQDSIIHSAVDLNKIRNQCTESVSKLELYKYFETIGLEYSGAFQGITELYKNNREAFGVVNLPETVANQGYIIHPALLDAAFQVMASLGYSNTKEAYLPFEIAHVAINSPIASKVFVHVVERESNDAKVKIADLYLYDESGVLLLEIIGFSAVRANKAELLTIINSQNKAKVDDLLYTLKWREQVLAITTSEATPKSWCIVSENKNITIKLIASIKKSGDTVTTELPTTGQLDRVIYICGDEKLTNIDKPSCVYEQALELTQYLVKNKILTDTGKLIFVTQSAQQINDLQDEYSLSQAPLVGLARVIALEHPELHSRIIDLDASDLNIELLLTELNAVDAEGQVAFRQGTRFVPRLIKYTKELNPYLDSTYLGFTATGSIDNLEFKALVKKALKPDEVEIEVKAAGLNFRDVLNVMGLYPGDPGLLGGECSGIITAVGANVIGFRVGDEVLAEASGAFAKYVTTPYQLVTHKPKNINFVDAAAIPVVFLTVHYALNTLAKLKAGEKVLIHAAAGGIGMAAIQIAKNLGAEIFVTVGSAAKRKLMQDMGIPDDHIMNSRNTEYSQQIMQVTNNKGVEVVLNSLTGGDFIPKSLAVLALNGRFLEIGKRDIWTVEQVKELRPDVQYSIIAIDTLSQQQPELIGKLLAELMQEFASGKLKPIAVTQYPINEAKKAFRFMAQGKHIGKIVLTMQDEQTQSKAKQITIKANANYLITGGLGGLGLEVAKWLATQGAKNLILVSRNEPSAQAKELVSNLEQTGVTVKTIQADIAKPSDVTNIFKQFKITGVIHVAGVLDDAELLQQNFDKYLKVSNPKILGAINLQDAIVKSKHQLDFFVSFSSAASILGNMGQSNYAAANAFLDTFAFYQRQQNVNAISINWGAWSGIGLAVNMDNASIEQMALYGIRPISPDTGIMALEQILFRSALATEPIVLDINWQRYFSQIDVNTQPVLADIAVNLNKFDKNTNEHKNNEFIQKLTAASSEKRYEILSQYLELEIKKVMGLDASAAIDKAAGLSAMGMDSLMAVEFRNRIIKTLGDSFNKNLPATLMFNYPNINALTKYLLEDILNLEVKVIEKSQEEVDKLELEKIMLEAKSVKDDAVDDELMKEILKAKQNLIGDDHE